MTLNNYHIVQMQEYSLNFSTGAIVAKKLWGRPVVFLTLNQFTNFLN